MSTTPTRTPSRPRPKHSPSSPNLARPSSISLRPLLAATRLRARSVTSGGGASAPVPYLSPTIEGSPTLPTLPSSWRENGKDRSSGTESGGENDHDNDSTTETDSIPVTPDDFYDASSHFGSTTHFWQVEQPSSSEDEGVDELYIRPTLDKSTRRSLRRGRSFTSLLAQSQSQGHRPGTPALEKAEPLWEAPPSTVPGVAVFPPAATSFATEQVLDRKRLRDFVPQLIVLGTLFTVSFVLVLGLIATLPTFFVPHALSDLPVLTSSLQSYRSSSFFAEVHLFAVLTAFFLWKQCFSIPGSILTNVLFGALYGSYIGTFWACIWTATGSTGAYTIARIISPLVEHYFATPLNMTRRALHLPVPGEPVSAAGTALSDGDMFSYLLLARFFPLLPYSVLNVIGGVLRLPVTTFFTTLVIGSFPFNLATVSIGDVVAAVIASGSDSASDTLSNIWRPEVIQKLVLATMVSVLPLIFKRQLQRLLSAGGLAATWTVLSGLPTLARSFVGSLQDENLVEAMKGIPTQLYCIWTRIKDAALRRMFGFGAVGSFGGAPSSSMSMPARNGRSSYNPIPAFTEDDF